MKSKYKEIINSLIPAIIFLVTFRFFSFELAVLLGFGLGIISYVTKLLKEKKLSALDYLGIIGLVVQTLVSVLAENPTTYFVYPIISNIIYAGIFGGSLIINKDIISIIGKKLCETEKSYDVLRPLFRIFTLLWFILFLIKSIVKILGISRLSFESMYTINWLLGTPFSILLLWFCYWYPNKYYHKKVDFNKNLLKKV